MSTQLTAEEYESKLKDLRKRLSNRTRDFNNRGHELFLLKLKLNESASIIADLNRKLSEKTKQEEIQDMLIKTQQNSISYLEKFRDELLCERGFHNNNTIIKNPHMRVVN